MAETAKQYFERMCKEAGKTDAEIAALSAVLTGDKFSETVHSANDFQAMQGRAVAADKKAKDLTEDWYPKVNREYLAMKEQLDAAKDALAAALNGTGGGAGDTAVDTSKFLTKDDLLAISREQDTKYAAVIKQATRLASRHAARYHEELDTEALEAAAIKGGYQRNVNGTLVPDLEAAYKEMNADRDAKTQKEAHDAELQKAREEAVRDYASKHKMPVDPVPAETSPLFLGTREAPKDLDAQLMEAWQGAQRR